MATFGDFLYKKERDNKENLRLLGLIFKKSGFKVKSGLGDGHSPYVFIYKPSGLSKAVDDLSFDGVRLYFLGEVLAYRPQMRHNSQPFGEAYNMDVTGMFRDLMAEGDKKAGLKVIHYIIQELRDFFIQSGKADQEMPDGGDDGQMGMIVGGTGSDYSNKVTGLNRS